MCCLVLAAALASASRCDTLDTSLSVLKALERVERVAICREGDKEDCRTAVTRLLGALDLQVLGQPEDRAGGEPAWKKLGPYHDLVWKLPDWMTVGLAGDGQSEFSVSANAAVARLYELAGGLYDIPFYRARGIRNGAWARLRNGGKDVRFRDEATVPEKVRAYDRLMRASREDLAHEIRPGGADGRPFWNGQARVFAYPPSFDFRTFPGARKYLFRILDDAQQTHAFEAEGPKASLAPVWPMVPAGLTVVECRAVDGEGRDLGLAGSRRFWRQATFDPAACAPAKRSYAEAIGLTLDYLFDWPDVAYLERHGEPDVALGNNFVSYPSKMLSAVIQVMAQVAERDPLRRERALKVARIAADYLLRAAEGDGTPLAGFTQTYCGKGQLSGTYSGQHMLVYPAMAGSAFLRLFSATRDAKYRRAAERIGRKYLELQGEDGTWFLKLNAKDGSPVASNRLLPTSVLPFLEELYAETGDGAFRRAADRAFVAIDRGPLVDWNWEGQFEDIAPARARYQNLTKHMACDTALYILKRFPGDARRLAQAREILRFAEDQFVFWKRPCRADGTGAWTPIYPFFAWRCPAVLEQYNCYSPIDASAAKLIRTYLALYRAEGNPLDLAKARALGDSMVNNQDASGRIRTYWIPEPGDDDPLAGAIRLPLGGDWYNCMAADVAALLQLDAGEIVLAERGRPAEYRIVVPAKPTPVLEYAAEEFRDWTEKLTGVRLAIETNTTPAKAVYVGGATEEGLGTDGFRIRAEGESVRILGSSDKRGVLYGVYELLEAYGGIGWFASWHTVVPKADRFAIPATLDDRQIPVFAWREPFAFDANRHHEFAARLRKNSDWYWNGIPPKLGGGYMGCCRKLRGHSFYQVIPPEKYYDAHPEWFSEVNGKRLRKNGQLCLSNPGMRATAISNVLEMVRAEPQCDYLVVAHNDWYNFCTCPACRAVDEEEGSPSGGELRFVNEIAEAVEREFPGKLLKMSAYQYTRVPPKVTRPRRNVIVDFAPIEADYSRPIAESVDGKTVEIRRDIAGWGEIASEQGLLVFDYVANFNHYVMPYPNLRSLQENVRFYRDHKVRFLMEEDDHCGHHGDFTELKTWLLAKWMWNPELDGEALLTRFLEGYYGAGAPFVRRYIDELHDLSAKSGCRLGCMANFTGDFVPDAFVGRALALWDRATEAVKDDPAYAYNVRMGRMSVVSLLLMRQGLRVSVQSKEYPDARIRALAKEMLETVEIAKKAGRPVSFAEGGYRPRGVDEKLVARWKRLADPAQTVQPRSRAVVEAEDLFDVWGGHETTLVDDPTASGGRAYRMPNRFSDKWIVHAPASAVGADAGAKYRYRLRVKAERRPGAPDGNLVQSGIGSRGAVTHKASEADGRWTWLDFGEWTLKAPDSQKDDREIFIAPGHFDKTKLNANPAYEYLWFDQVEFERVGDRTNGKTTNDKTR